MLPFSHKLKKQVHKQSKFNNQKKAALSKNGKNN